MAKTEKFFDINGYKLFCEFESTTDPIIFLHHSYGSTRSWKDFPARLAAQLNLNWVLYDRKGYGKSDAFQQIPRDTDYHQQEAKELLLLLDRLEIKKCHLYGFSDGGNIALEACALEPTRFHKAIVEGVHVLNQQRTKEGIRYWDDAFKGEKIKRSLKKLHGDKYLWVHNVWAHSWLLPIFADWNCFESLKKITTSVLTIQGLEDEFGDLEQVAMLDKYLSGPHEKLVIDEAGHCVHKEFPDEVIQKCAEFINTNINAN